jgi:hypothetical protein
MGGPELYFRAPAGEEVKLWKVRAGKPAVTAEDLRALQLLAG